MGRKRIKKEVIEDKEVVETTTTVRPNKKLKSSAKFKCNECNEEFETTEAADKHIFKEHYGLARINDDSKTAFTDNEIIKALIKAQKAFKTLKCKRNGCEKSFKSGLGLKSHWEMCGKTVEELMAVCDLCGKRLKKISMSSHMKCHAIKEKPVTKETTGHNRQSTDNGNTSGKRASAIRAKQTIKKTTRGEIIISGTISDEEFVADSDATEEEISADEAEDVAKERIESSPKPINQRQITEQKFKTVLKLWADFIISANDLLREIPKGSYEVWNKQISAKGKVKCPLKDCNQSFTTKDGLKYHYQRCGIDLKYVWKCKICQFEAIKGNRLIAQHMWNTHRDSLPKISEELSVCIETANVGITPNKSREKPNVSIHSSFIDFHKQNFKKKSFSHLMPKIDSWIQLKEEEYNIYIQNPNPSVNFRSTSSSNDSWIQLNLFDSMATKCNLNFFVGGPVWATDWCPLPIDSKDCDQYLAVASNMNPEISHTFNDTDIESGLIQIWNVGKLGKKFDATLKPMMAFSIAHFCGMVWDMKWCPGGTTWEDINSNKNKRSKESLYRLGLLAIACGDGFVRIHSIPHPQTLPNSYEYSLYYNEPIVILNPPGVGNSVNNENSICKCISWIRSNNQRLVVGGYGNGMISVWDLTTKSSLLIVDQNPNQLILKPLNSWFGHSAAVNRIKWFDTSSAQFIVSCSYDRSAKLWNLRDLSVPITVFRKGLITAVDTHYQWNGLFLANDDCYSGFQNNILFKDFGSQDFGALQLSCHKSCVWDLSVSEWFSASVSVDASGEAVIFPNFQCKADPKRKPFDRIPLYHIRPVLLETQDCDTIDPKLKKLKKNSLIDEMVGSDITKAPLRTYTEFSSKYGLVFNDYDMSDLKAIPLNEINRIRLATNMQYQRLSDYPLTSINRVCWNPNLSSCAWILSATQSGLCRLSCVSFLSPTDIKL